jgi:4-amino-4-deoxy-L-arabinose transferase-like glycosyltransferase
MKASPRYLPLIDLLCLSLLYIWIATYSYPFFFKSLANNYREIQSYNVDSMMMLKATGEALSAPWFKFTFDDYGHLYFNISLVVAYIYSIFLPLDERSLFFILRLVSLLGGCLSIALVFIFAKRFLGRIEAIFAAAVIAFSPALIEYSNEVKPDTWQVFLITLSIYFLARAVETPASTDDGGRNRQPAASLRFVLAAGAAAGAAFGTKYLGMFLSPLLAIAALLVPTTEISERFFARIMQFLVLFAAVTAVIVLVWAAAPPRIFRAIFSEPWMLWGLRIGCILISAACVAFNVAYLKGFDYHRYKAALAKIAVFVSLGLAFVVAFAVSSPWLVSGGRFLMELHSRSGIVSSGSWYGFSWLPVLFREQLYVWEGIGALAVFGGILLFIRLCMRDFRSPYLPFMFVFGFAAIFIALLIVKINRMTVLYAIPIIPPFALLAAFGIYEIRSKLILWLGARPGMAIAAAGAASLAIVQMYQGTSRLLTYPNLVVALAPHNQMLNDWYPRCASVDAKMLIASYAFAPPRYEKVVLAEGYSYFAALDPDIVILNLVDVEAIAKDAARAGANADSLVSSRTRYYETIRHSGAWHAGPVFGPMAVYWKNGSSKINSGCS